MKQYATFSNGFKHDGLNHHQMSFRVGQTLNCVPPYVEGQMDSVWIKTRGALPAPTNRSSIEDLAGMKVLPL